MTPISLKPISKNKYKERSGNRRGIGNLNKSIAGYINQYKQTTI